jgi:hypothetical protein
MSKTGNRIVALHRLESEVQAAHAEESSLDRSQDVVAVQVTNRSQIRRDAPNVFLH